MAMRIEEQVVRGEIDNTVHGRVTGRIWLSGQAEPLELDLEGNCWRDLAGRRLEFSNPEPKAGSRPVPTDQRGTVGDISASRKVKVPDIPMEEIGEYYAAKKPFPWHWGNALYLEWFSQRSGRVVIESASYELKIAGEPAWEMTLAEEEAQRAANGKAMTGFMDLITAAAESETAEWNEAPQTEEEAERMQARSDRLVDRIQARMTREGADADFEGIMEDEIERLREEFGEPKRSPGFSAKTEEPNWDSPVEEEFDPDAFSTPEHPLAERAQELSFQVIETQRENGWAPEGASEEHPASYLVESILKAGVKLAGALNRSEWPPDIDYCAGILVSLKRAREYLDDALSALESCQEQKLLEPAWMGVILVEVIDIAKDADEIIAELRARLERGIG